MKDILFKEVASEFVKHPTEQTILPERGTSQSGGYDIRIKEDLVIEPNSQVLTWTDVKICVPENYFLDIRPRSSVATKQNITLSNVPPVIDADYQYNDKTGGNIGLCLHNFGDKHVFLDKGTRVVQGIIQRYYTTDDDNATTERSGGFGSTGK